MVPAEAVTFVLWLGLSVSWSAVFRIEPVGGSRLLLDFEVV
jgi:hypothetical protein